MTDEEIEEQAEEYATEDLPDGYTKINYIKKQVYMDGVKWGIANAIEWHDLRKDPKDLPKEDCETVTLHENGNKNIIKWKHGEWTNAIVIPVIAWCELQKFKG